MMNEYKNNIFDKSNNLINNNNFLKQIDLKYLINIINNKDFKNIKIHLTYFEKNNKKIGEKYKSEIFSYNLSLKLFDLFENYNDNDLRLIILNSLESICYLEPNENSCNDLYLSGILQFLLRNFKYQIYFGLYFRILFHLIKYSNDSYNFLILNFDLKNLFLLSNTKFYHEEIRFISSFSIKKPDFIEILLEEIQKIFLYSLKIKDKLLLKYSLSTIDLYSYFPNINFFNLILENYLLIINLNCSKNFFLLLFHRISFNGLEMINYMSIFFNLFFNNSISNDKYFLLFISKIIRDFFNFIELNLLIQFGQEIFKNFEDKKFEDKLLIFQCFESIIKTIPNSFVLEFINSNIIHFILLGFDLDNSDLNDMLLEILTIMKNSQIEICGVSNLNELLGDDFIQFHNRVLSNIKHD